MSAPDDGTDGPKGRAHGEGEPCEECGKPLALVNVKHLGRVRRGGMPEHRTWCPWCADLRRPRVEKD